MELFGQATLILMAIFAIFGMFWTDRHWCNTHYCHRFGKFYPIQLLMILLVLGIKSLINSIF